MLGILKKTETIFNKKVLIYMSIAYIVLKNIIIVNSSFLTYIYMTYCLLFYFLSCFYFEKIRLKDYLLSIVFLLSFLISTLINKRLNRENIAIMIDVFINFFVYLHLFDRLENEEIDNLLTIIFKFFTIFSFIWAIVGIGFIVTNSSIDLFGNQFGMINHSRLQLVRPSVNPTGFAAIAFIACNLYFFFKKDVFNRCFIIVNIIMQLIVLLFTQSFGSFLALFAGIFVFAIYKGINNNNILRYIFYSVIAIIVVLIIGIVLTNLFGANSRITTDIMNLLANKDAFVSLKVRYEILIYGLLVLLNTNLLFGSSYGGLKKDWANQFNFVTSKYQFSKYFINESAIINTAATHNSYFTILFANGILGLIVLLFFIVLILYNIVYFYNNLNKIEIKIHADYLTNIFLIFTGMVIALTAECIIVSIVDYTNFFFFIALSALINLNKNNRFIIDK